MAVWQITKNGKPINAPLFDDGSNDAPGDETFSTDKARAKATELDADSFNYVGLSPQPTTE